MSTRPAVPDVAPDAAPAPLADILSTLAADLAAGGDLRELLRRLLEPLMTMAGAQAGAVRVLSAAGDRLQMVSHIGLPEPVAIAEQSVDPACGVCGSAVARASVEWARDVRHCLRHGNGDFFGLDCRHVLAVPLTHRGRVLGLFNLFFAVEPTPDPTRLALFKAVGELLGLALNNARLEGDNLQAALVSQRQAMAAEVHDSVAQTLAFVKMRMPLLHESIAAQDTASALRYCDDVRQAASAAHTNLRQLLSEFRVPMDPQGLKHALQSSILVFAQRTQVALEFDDQAPTLRLSPTQESQVFHIVQESFANIAKHASARHAWLRLGQALGRVDVLIEDDGTGLPAADVLPTGSHLGVEIMRERAIRLGGRLDIGPRTGGGTRVHLSFPLAVDPTLGA
jgi:two-component system nitrate/nitrite sensor histidine kinase NarX